VATKSEEFIYNWNNQLESGTHRERQTLLIREAQSLRKSGYNQRDALDMLLADNEDLIASETAINFVYADAKTEPANERIAEVVVPTSYKDIKSTVESKLKEIGAQKFISVLCDSNYPVIRTSKRGRESLTRLAESAQDMKHAMNSLHETLAPYFETAMLDSVLLASKLNARIAEKKDGVFDCELTNKNVTVDIRQASSNSDRFTGGNFGEFGLACEYIVKVADHISPHERLRKAVSSK
jgi:hypothetical protein